VPNSNARTNSHISQAHTVSLAISAYHARLFSKGSFEIGRCQEKHG